MAVSRRQNSVRAWKLEAASPQRAKAQAALYGDSVSDVSMELARESRLPASWRGREGKGKDAVCWGWSVVVASDRWLWTGWAYEEGAQGLEMNLRCILVTYVRQNCGQARPLTAPRNDVRKKTFPASGKGASRRGQSSSLVFSVGSSRRRCGDSRAQLWQCSVKRETAASRLVRHRCGKGQ